ncbi:MAG: hypothetical protein CL534_09035 [Ahrensia sp.]|nr:hypothetical protein [Ahrensia sp.]
MTDAERKRKARARQKAAIKEAQLQVAQSPDYLQGSFSEFVGDRMFEFEENLDAFGARVIGSELNAEVQDFDTQFSRDEPLTSLQRAIGLVDVFIDAATEIAGVINAYKLEEANRAIEAAVTESANLPRGDTDALKASLKKIDRLKGIQSELQKPTRHTIPAIRTKEELNQLISV